MPFVKWTKVSREGKIKLVLAFTVSCIFKIFWHTMYRKNCECLHSLYTQLLSTADHSNGWLYSCTWVYNSTWKYVSKAICLWCRLSVLWVVCPFACMILCVYSCIQLFITMDICTRKLWIVGAEIFQQFI